MVFWVKVLCMFDPSIHPNLLLCYFLALSTMSPDIGSHDRRMKYMQNRSMKCMPNWYTLHIFSHCKPCVICTPLGKSGLQNASIKQDNSHFWNLFLISGSNGTRGAATVSCRQQAANLQLLSKVTNFTVPCSCVKKWLLLLPCTARNQMAFAHSMMENGQLLTDFIIKNIWVHCYTVSAVSCLLNSSIKMHSLLLTVTIGGAKSTRRQILKITTLIRTKTRAALSCAKQSRPSTSFCRFQ